MKYRRRVLSITLVLLFGAITTAAQQSWAEITVDPNVTLPVTIDKTWYRTGKVRLFGKSYEQSGTLTVSEDGVDFSSDKGKVSIAKESITSVVRGFLSPDIQNAWVIIRYTNPAGEAIAAFKGALFSGDDKESLILSAILKLNAGATADVPSQVQNPE